MQAKIIADVTGLTTPLHSIALFTKWVQEGYEVIFSSDPSIAKEAFNIKQLVDVITAGGCVVLACGKLGKTIKIKTATSTWPNKDLPQSGVGYLGYIIKTLGDVKSPNPVGAKMTKSSFLR